MKAQVTAINRARIVQLANSAIAAIQALLAETGDGAEALTVQPPTRPPVSKNGADWQKCPDCGGPMVERNSSRGPFYGCRQYPHCTGTRPGNGTAHHQKPSEYAPGGSESDSWEGAR